MTTARRDCFVGLGLALLTAGIFAPACANAFVDYDDPDYVTENHWVRDGLTRADAVWAFTTDRTGNWHPLTWLSLQLDGTLFGNRAWGFHLTSVLLHAVNAGLVYWVVCSYTDRPWPAAAVAGLFALHPLRVESVAWISERKDVLSTLFGLLALLAYRRHVQAPSRWRYALVALAFLLSLLAKPMWVTLPCLLLLLDYWPLVRLKTPVCCAEVRKLLYEKAPLFLLALASCVITLHVQHAGRNVGSLDQFPFSTRIGNAAVAYATYLEKALWPSGLVPFYPHAREKIPAWQVVGACALLMVLTLLVVRQSARRPYLLMGWLWYLGTLVPVIGLVQVGTQALADRYTYLPMIGLTWGLVWAVADLERGQPAWIAGTGAALILAALALVTERQLRIWRDAETLWTHTIQVTEGNWVADTNLANHYLGGHRFDDAGSHFESALRALPTSPLAKTGLGYCYLYRGDLDRAMGLFKECAAEHPKYPTAVYAIGLVYNEKGQLKQAAKYFQAALQLDSEHVEAHIGLGAIHAALAAAHRSRGLVQEERQELAAAERCYREAVGLRPGSADIHLDLGAVLDREGKDAEALVYYRRAVQLAPGMAMTHFNLGTFSGKRGNWPDAIRYLNEAVRLDPGYAAAYHNLGMALDATGRRAQSQEAFRRARELAANRKAETQPAH